ncbi:MAG: TolC family protein [Rhodocyclaceae bacterium]|nr:TolC family protein [Rhodocyclaceae bacterium]
MRATASDYGRALAIAQQNYRSGAITLLDLLETDRNTSSARISAASAVNEVAQTGATLKIATGAGFAATRPSSHCLETEPRWWEAFKTDETYWKNRPFRRIYRRSRRDFDAVWRAIGAVGTDHGIWALSYLSQSTGCGHSRRGSAGAGHPPGPQGKNRGRSGWRCHARRRGLPVTFDRRDA